MNLELAHVCATTINQYYNWLIQFEGFSYTGLKKYFSLPLEFFISKFIFVLLFYAK